MFEGWFDNVLAKALKAFNAEDNMKFREQANYKARFVSFGEAIRAYLEAKEENPNTTSGLEELMLEAYRFFRFIRRENNIMISHKVSQRPVETALYEAVSILDEPLEYCVPLYQEADALETLSFSIWKKLKDTGDLKYCKHCKEYLHGKCRKHKEPTSVEDLIYCNTCKGWMTTPCPVHGYGVEL